MKPRLFKRQGLWHCRRQSQGFHTAGIGYTPALAYADWLGKRRFYKRACA